MEGAYGPITFETIGVFKALKFGSRYFTRGQSKSPSMAVPASINSNNIISSHLGPRLQFTQDNVVEYLKREKVDGATVYEPCKPSIFRRGQVVEAQVSFVGISMKDGRRTFVAKLNKLVWLHSGCAIDLIDADEAGVAQTPVIVEQKRFLPYGDGPAMKKLRESVEAADMHD
ncbi:hypothetical protein M422DRAFT_261187 [Sphaerobolus stellatus SS14]|uniref:Uncharacterized protein n=1 Tax=Sphaerobolus stellatus (strain SS14) TaxID=990650 RepID=A0A0C9UNQ4_SPHS4|nr:hypothetical protein M422DRAFT_261187 [Sphaerobolus stellatus SS14]